MIARAECDDMTLHSRYLCFYTRSGDVIAAASRSGHVTLVATRDDDAVTRPKSPDPTEICIHVGANNNVPFISDSLFSFPIVIKQFT